MNKKLFVIRRAMIGATLSASLLISSAAFSTSVKKVSTLSAPIRPSVRYVGNDQAGSFFQVKFDGEIPVKFNLTIIDANGNTLYNQGFESSSFSQYIKLVNEGFESIGQITFTIRTQDGTRHSFQVTTSEQEVNNVVVTKM